MKCWRQLVIECSEIIKMQLRFSVVVMLCSGFTTNSMQGMEYEDGPRRLFSCTRPSPIPKIQVVDNDDEKLRITDDTRILNCTRTVNCER